MNYFIASPRRLFLADALGAMLTAFLTAGVLTRYEPFFGMPADVLYQLALAGLVFMLYSFGCFLLLRRGFSPYLRIIALANTGYGLTTLLLCLLHRNQLTAWAWAYFIGECLVVFVLARVEMKVAATVKSSTGVS